MMRLFNNKNNNSKTRYELCCLYTVQEDIKKKLLRKQHPQGWSQLTRAAINISLADQPKELLV